MQDQLIQPELLVYVRIDPTDKGCDSVVRRWSANELLKITEQVFTITAVEAKISDLVVSQNELALKDFLVHGAVQIYYLMQNFFIFKLVPKKLTLITAHLI